MVTIKSGIADTAGYAMSKAAALMATTKWAVKLKDEGFIVVSVTPGMVDTSGTVGESGESRCPLLLLRGGLVARSVATDVRSYR